MQACNPAIPYRPLQKSQGVKFFDDEKSLKKTFPSLQVALTVLYDAMPAPPAALLENLKMIPRPPRGTGRQAPSRQPGAGTNPRSKQTRFYGIYADNVSKKRFQNAARRNSRHDLKTL
jgi:hypothetical protein